MGNIRLSALMDSHINPSNGSSNPTPIWDPEDFPELPNCQQKLLHSEEAYDTHQENQKMNDK